MNRIIRNLTVLFALTAPAAASAQAICPDQPAEITVTANYTSGFGDERGTYRLAADGGDSECGCYVREEGGLAIGVFAGDWYMLGRGDCDGSTLPVMMMLKRGADACDPSGLPDVAVPATFAPTVSVVVGETCPAGTALATLEEAEALAAQGCGVLGWWFIARLALGGSISGPGYHCGTFADDDRTLGHAVCVRADFTLFAGDGTCPAGYAEVDPVSAAANLSALRTLLGRWDIVRLAGGGGGSMDGYGYGSTIRDTDNRTLGATLCRPAHCGG